MVVSVNPVALKRILKITYVSIDSVTPYSRNARRHSRKQVGKIMRSLAERGFTQPIVVDREARIVCGHGRVEAATQLGLTEVPVVVLEDMSDEEIRAYIIADNALAEQAHWDRAMLANELQGLVDLGYDVELTGFDTLEIDTLLSIDTHDTADQDDIVPEPLATPPVSRVGDLWTIGYHRLLVGDARAPVVIERLMAGERAQLVITDPPYGCAITGFVSGHHDNFVMGAGEVSLPELGMAILRPAFKNIAAHCAPGAIAFVFSDWRAAVHMLDAANGVFHETKNWIVWVKTNAGLGTFYRSQFELVFAFKVSPGKTINNFGLGEGGRHRSNVWTYAGANTFRRGRAADLADHPTVKPKRLVADAILDCSRRGGIVLDVFAGSGTSLVSAEMTGRRGYGIELDPKYADVILTRVSKEVGQPALLEGIAFADIAASRRNVDEELA